MYKNHSNRANIIFLAVIFIVTIIFGVGILIIDKTESSPRNKITPYKMVLSNKTVSKISPSKTPSPTIPSPTIQKPSPTPVTPKISIVNSCPTNVSDIDGNAYKTIQIGVQCWMKENLRVTKNPVGKGIKRYCYNNDENICNTDGGLYDWNTAINNSREEGAQGICPDDWHIPKDSEWHILEDYLKDPDQSCDNKRKGVRDCDAAGSKLMSKSPNDFNAILAGARDAGGTYGFRESFAIFQSSTAESDTKVFVRDLNSDNSKVGRGTIAKTISFSIRCIKD